jgi:histidinol phosphatase-like enzyme
VFEGITGRFVEEVKRKVGRIHGVCYCTHQKEDGCDCREPKPGLLLKAQREHSFSFADTFLISNSESHVQAAQTVGCPASLVSDTGPDYLEELAHRPQGLFPSSYAAAGFILRIGLNPQSNSGKVPKRKQRGA